MVTLKVSDQPPSDQPPSDQSRASPTRLAGLGEVVPRFDAFICDIWGVLHDGQRAFPAALDCLIRARAAGVVVVLVSNTPKPHGATEMQLAGFGIRKDIHFDAVLTAGDLARAAAIALGGRACYHLGPDRDHAILEGVPGPVVERIEDADYILATGLLHDDREGVEDYAPLLEKAHSIGLPMICANPDLHVYRGPDVVPCAGLLAQAYWRMGGDVRYFGKPYAAIYDEALGRVAVLGGGVPAKKRVLAIGDGLDTDIRGAAHAGFETLFITSGIHRNEVGPKSGMKGAERLSLASDPMVLDALFSATDQWPDWAMDHLEW